MDTRISTQECDTTGSRVQSDVTLFAEERLCF